MGILLVRCGLEYGHYTAFLVVVNVTSSCGQTWLQASPPHEVNPVRHLGHINDVYMWRCDKRSPPTSTINWMRLPAFNHLEQ